MICPKITPTPDFALYECLWDLLDHPPSTTTSVPILQLNSIPIGNSPVGQQLCLMFQAVFCGHISYCAVSALVACAEVTVYAPVTCADVPICAPVTCADVTVCAPVTCADVTVCAPVTCADVTVCAPVTCADVTFCAPVTCADVTVCALVTCAMLKLKNFCRMIFLLEHFKHQ